MDERLSVWLLSTTDLSRGVGVTQVIALAEELGKHGIDCRLIAPQQNRRLRGFLPIIQQFSILCRALKTLKVGPKPKVIIARSFQTLFLAIVLSKFARSSVVYDLRGLWTITRLERTRNLVTSLLPGIERILCRGIDGAVHLTYLGQEITDSRIFRTKNHIQSIVIPTLTDFDRFSPKPKGSDLAVDIVESNKEKRVVVGLIGSMNEDYLTETSIKIFSRAHESNPQIKLLVSSPTLPTVAQRETIFSTLEDTSYSIQSVSNLEMPEVLKGIDIALMIMRLSPSKAGSMPTRLSEFFSAEIPIIFYGCNSEVEEWVRKYPIGYVLENLSDHTIQLASNWISESNFLSLRIDNEESLENFRLTAKNHFSISAGGKKYATFLKLIAAKK